MAERRVSVSEGWAREVMARDVLISDEARSHQNDQNPRWVRRKQGVRKGFVGRGTDEFTANVGRAIDLLLNTGKEQRAN
jgi:hypothetical protein